jgi:altronate dehydratase small subunit
MDATDRRLLLLDPRDDVLTVTRAIEAGEEIVVQGHQVRVPTLLPLGHKVALHDIPAGGKIRKYGVAIGSATRAIAVGEHVHTQNLRSDYLPTYLLETQHRYFESAHHPAPASA